MFSLAKILFKVPLASCNKITKNDFSNGVKRQDLTEDLREHGFKVVSQTISSRVQALCNLCQYCRVIIITRWNLCIHISCFPRTSGWAWYLCTFFSSFHWGNVSKKLFGLLCFCSQVREGHTLSPHDWYLMKRITMPYNWFRRLRVHLLEQTRVLPFPKYL